METGERDGNLDKARDFCADSPFLLAANFKSEDADKYSSPHTECRHAGTDYPESLAAARKEERLPRRATAARESGTEIGNAAGWSEIAQPTTSRDVPKPFIYTQAFAH